MNKHLPKSAVSFTLMAFSVMAFVVLMHNRAPASQAANDQPLLGSCSGSTVIFPNDVSIFDPGYLVDSDGAFRPTGKLDAWRQRYDSNINDIIKAHTEDRAIQCTEIARESPSGFLRSVAKDLAPWSTPERLDALSEEDMGAVLIEQLRVYQCRIREQLLFRTVRTDLETLKRQGTLTKLSIGTEWMAYSEQTAWAEREFVESSKALLRTLKFLEGANRLRPLDDSLECLARTSLDIRNTLGLAADVSACLPRVWDTRGTLKNLPPPKQQP